MVFVFGPFWVLGAVFSSWGLKNRIRHEILHLLTNGELWGVRFIIFYDNFVTSILFSFYGIQSGHRPKIRVLRSKGLTISYYYYYVDRLRYG